MTDPNRLTVQGSMTMQSTTRTSVETTITRKGYVEAMKVNAFPEFIRELAMRYNVKLTLNVEKRWIRETTFYELTGNRSGVESVSNQIRQAIASFQ